MNRARIAPSANKQGPTFFLEVDSSALSRALKELGRVEKRNSTLQLSFSPGQLSITAGQSSKWIPAAGSWPEPIFVSRAWGQALATRPFKVAVITLTVSEGKLRARDYVVPCQFEDYSDEDRSFKQGNIAKALEVLNEYAITEEELGYLIDSREHPYSKWGAGDALVIKQVAETWRHLAYYGVDPGEIKVLIDAKTRRLMCDSRSEKPTGLLQLENSSHEDQFFRRGNVVKASQVLKQYGVSEQDVEDLIGSGNFKGLQSVATNATVIRDVAETWTHLAYHGVSPYEIQLLIQNKLRKLINESKTEKSISPPSGER